MAVIHNSFGIWIASGRASGWREMLRMPLVHAAAFGLVLSATGVTLPSLVAKPVGLLAQTAIPLMLLSLGYTLHQIRPAALRPALAATTLRMAGGFATAFVFVSLSGASGVLRSVVLLSSSMPAAVLNVVLAQRFDADADVVGTTVLLSTLLSLFTVPLVLQLAG
jgi:hypothetical protein